MASVRIPSWSSKPWDIVLSPERRKNAIRNRRGPTGMRFPVGYTESKRSYPWKMMRDGDYFVVPVSGSKDAMIVAMRQAAVRHDIEISIRRIIYDGAVCLQVTRIMGDIRRTKLRARALGAKIVIGRGPEERRDAARGRSIPADLPDTLPTPSPSTGEPYDRAARLAEARAAAIRDLENDDV